LIRENLKWEISASDIFVEVGEIAAFEDVEVVFQIGDGVRMVAGQDSSLASRLFFARRERSRLALLVNVGRSVDEALKVNRLFRVGTRLFDQMNAGPRQEWPKSTVVWALSRVEIRKRHCSKSWNTISLIMNHNLWS